MSELPKVTAEQLKSLLPTAESAELIGHGGQKLVFRVRMDSKDWAVKVAKVPQEAEDHEEPFDVVSSRAKREIETMRDCVSPHMVKLGPVGLTFTETDSEHILFFSEQFIPGKDLERLLRDEGALGQNEVIRMGIQITDAIKELWALGKVHRDIKPGNIMRRDDSGDYILLDAGLVFDVVGESLSRGFVVGTMLYFSPEQFDYSSRRTVLDFRSDMFALGVTMYRMLTGKHPFSEGVTSVDSFYTKVKTYSPDPPSAHRPAVSKSLDAVILRLLAKVPHLRYRRCTQLITALRECEG